MTHGSGLMTQDSGLRTHDPGLRTQDSPLMPVSPPRLHPPDVPLRGGHPVVRGPVGLPRPDLCPLAAVGHGRPAHLPHLLLLRLRSPVRPARGPDAAHAEYLPLQYCVYSTRCHCKLNNRIIYYHEGDYAKTKKFK